MTFRFGNKESVYRQEIPGFLSAEEARELQFAKKADFSLKNVNSVLSEIFFQVQIAAGQDQSSLVFDLGKASKTPTQRETLEVISRLSDVGYIVALSGTLLEIKWANDGK